MLHGREKAGVRPATASLSMQQAFKHCLGSLSDDISKSKAQATNKQITDITTQATVKHGLLLVLF